MGRMLKSFKPSTDLRGWTSCLAWLEARATEHGGAINKQAMEALRCGRYLGEKGFKDKLLDLSDQSADKLRGKKSIWVMP